LSIFFIKPKVKKRIVHGKREKLGKKNLTNSEQGKSLNEIATQIKQQDKYQRDCLSII